jgi:hypothetical protein
MSPRGAAAAVLIAIGLIAPAQASAADSCSFDVAERTVTILTDDFDVLSRSGDNIQFNSANCLDGATPATVTNTNTITVTDNGAGDQVFTINLSIGPFAPGFTPEAQPGETSEIEIEIDLGGQNANDILDIVGTPNIDHFRLGPSGINLNVDSSIDDFDVTGPSAGTLFGNGNLEHFRITPGTSNDIVNASPSNQPALPVRIHVFDGDGQDDVVTGGDSLADVIDYGGAANGVTVDLATTAPQNTGAGTDTLAGFEWLFGSNFGDVLLGNAANNTLIGDTGIDRLAGRVGDDEMNGGPNGEFGDAVDYSEAPAGVFVDLDNSAPQPTLGAGTDEIDRVENLIGSPFADTLQGNEDPNVVTGGAGVDGIRTEDEVDQVLIRDGESDSARCGAGVDSVIADFAGLDLFPNADCEQLDLAPPPPALSQVPAAKKKKCKKRKRRVAAAKKKKCKKRKRRG